MFRAPHRKRAPLLPFSRGVRVLAVEAMADLPCQDTVCAVVVGCVFAALLLACVGGWICFTVTRDESAILPHQQPASDCRRACCGWRDPHEAIAEKNPNGQKSSPLWDAMLPNAPPTNASEEGSLVVLHEGGD